MDINSRYNFIRNKDSQNNENQNIDHQNNDNLNNDDRQYKDRQNIDGQNIDRQNNDIYIVGAWIRGEQLAPNINGIVTFQEVSGQTQVAATIYGLPDYQPAREGKAPIGPFGFHIHEHGNCSIKDPSNAFALAGGHWNPTNQPHGNHAGDLPVLFSNHGFSQMTFVTDKFQPKDVLGKAVIIHQNPDDYRTEPAGNSGERIACGVIEYIPVK